MEYNIKKKSSTLAELNIIATSEDLEKAKEKAYQKMAKTIKLPGFRPGKAPIDLVKKHLGESVLEEALNILAIDSYNSIYEKLEPKPLHIPQFNLGKFEKGEVIEFTAEYEFLPETHLTKYKKLKVEIPKVENDPSFLEEILTKIQDANPQYLPKEFEDPEKNIIESNDSVLLDLKILKGQKELHHAAEFHFNLEFSDPTTVPLLKENLLNKKVGDEIKYDVKFDETKQFKKAAHKEVTVKAKVLEIRYKHRPELNDEFAKYLGYENLESLKNQIRENLEKEIKNYKKGEALQKIIEEIIEKNPIDVPEYLIDRQIDLFLEDFQKKNANSLPQGKITIPLLAQILNRKEEDLENELQKDALFVIKRELIFNWIVENEKITVSDEEVDKSIRELYAPYFREENSLERIVKNEKVRKERRDQLLYNKVIDFLYENSEIKENQKISVKKLYEEGKIRI